MFFNALNYLHFFKGLLKFKNVANHDKFYTAMNIPARLFLHYPKHREKNIYREKIFANKTKKYLRNGKIFTELKNIYLLR